jgi:hypothetical protein
MPRTDTIKNVPNAEVARMKAEAEELGATVTVTANGNDTSTVVATFPDSTAASAHASAAQAHASSPPTHSPGGASKSG